jgi:hypothetical protein
MRQRLAMTQENKCAHAIKIPTPPLGSKDHMMISTHLILILQL